MSKLMVVTGATGMQGSGVIDALATNPDWKIRGLTRNINSEKARVLADRGIEMVAANLDDETSLIDAFKGANAIFAVTDFYEPFATGIGPEKAMEIEYDRGVKLARAAAQTTTLEFYFWSTLPAASDLTNGEVKVPHFDGKGNVDAYIKKDPKPAGQYILPLPANTSTYIPSLGPVDNIGITVSGLLRYPYPKAVGGSEGGRYVHVTTGKYQIQEYFSKWADIAGKGKLQVLSVPFEQFEALHGMWGTELGLMVKFWENAGAPRMWGTVGEGDIMIDSRELEGVKDHLISTEETWRRADWSQY